MILRIAACVGLALGLPILGGTLQLEFGFVSSGGGGTGSGRYSISSTIGEPLASSDPASGGDFSSRPGFLSQVVRWINAVPVANQDIIERPAGGEAHFLAADLLGNDADGDWDPLQLLSVDATTVQGGGTLSRWPVDHLCAVADAWSVRRGWLQLSGERWHFRSGDWECGHPGRGYLHEHCESAPNPGVGWSAGTSGASVSRHRWTILSIATRRFLGGALGECRYFQRRDQRGHPLHRTARGRVEFLQNP
jgi:hypothetical protein